MRIGWILLTIWAVASLVLLLALVRAVWAGKQVQILYLLGRTLESLGRIPEALEAYRWLRREAPHYRDVAMRIESLSTRRMHRENHQIAGNSPWATQASQMWQGLLRHGK